MKQGGKLHIGVGASSILMIFVVLCLTTFGTLSYVTANADYKNTEKAAQAVTDTYKAQAKAQELLQSIDSELVQAGLDAEQAAEKGSLSALNLNVYAGRLEEAEVNDLLTGSLSPAEKRAALYQKFAEMRLSSLPGVVVEPGEATTVSFTCKADEKRDYAVSLCLNEYGAQSRYTLLGAQMQTDAGEENGEPTGGFAVPGQG